MCGGHSPLPASCAFTFSAGSISMLRGGSPGSQAFRLEIGERRQTSRRNASISRRFASIFGRFALKFGGTPCGAGARPAVRRTALLSAKHACAGGGFSISSDQGGSLLNGLILNFFSSIGALSRQISLIKSPSLSVSSLYFIYGNDTISLFLRSLINFKLI